MMFYYELLLEAKISVKQNKTGAILRKFLGFSEVLPSGFLKLSMKYSVYINLTKAQNIYHIILYIYVCYDAACTWPARERLVLSSYQRHS